MNMNSSIRLVRYLPFLLFLRRLASTSIPLLLSVLCGAKAVLALGGAQGFIGWWMVKSGLEGGAWAQQRLETGHEVRVSPYRLATHLSINYKQAPS